MDTSKILFILGGAFDGIDKIVEKRLGNSVLGFNADIRIKSEMDSEYILSHIIHQDLVKYGLIPELVGRMPILATLKNLDKDAFIRILTEPKNALVKQYISLFALDHVELVFEDAAIAAMAEIALEKSTGARGLRSIMENTLISVMYNVPSDPSISKVIITADCVRDGADPVFEYKTETVSAATE